MSRKQREEIEALREELRVLRASIPGRIDAEVRKARRTHTAQYDDASGRVIALERKVKQLEAQVAAQYRAVDEITGMTDPATAAAIDKAGADYRTWRAEHGLGGCRVKRGVA